MSFFYDLKVAVRSLWRIRMLWITVALTLALGIGANAAIFSVLRSVLLRPLANRDESHLLYLRQSAPGLGVENETFSVPEIDDLQHGLTTIPKLGTFSPIDFTVVGMGTPREIRAGVVDGDYFEVMGLRPVLGRLLNEKDDGPNAPGAIVLTYRFWNASLHSDANVIGKTVRLESFDGARSATIVGVLEPSVPYPVSTEIIANIVTSPHHLSATMVTGREHRMTEVFGRLAPGTTVDAARAELRSRYAAIVAAHPDVYKPSNHFMIDVTRMHDQINARANSIMWILFAAAGLLFVIACSNVANLVLARTVRRQSELAVRSALGANTAALRRALFAESLVMCVSGVLAALLLAWPMVTVLGRYAARFSVRAEGLKLDFHPGVVRRRARACGRNFSGLHPATAVGNCSFAQCADQRRTEDDRKQQPAPQDVCDCANRRFIPAAHRRRGAHADSLHTQKTRPPFDTSKVLAVNLPVMTYGRTPEQVANFYHEVQRRVSALPGVAHAATGFSVPWRDDQGLNISLAFAADGGTRKSDNDDWRAKFRSISPGYFDTLGVPLREGRDFRDSDKTGSERVVIVSQSLAERALSGARCVESRDALDRRCRQVHRYKHGASTHRGYCARHRRRKYHPFAGHDGISAL